MWTSRKLRKLCFLLLVALLFLEPAVAQPTLSTKSTTQEVSIDLADFLGTEPILQPDFMTNSNNELESSTTLQDSSNQSQLTSMDAANLLNNQDLLLDNLEEQWKALELQVQTLEIQSSSLEKDNRELKYMLDNSKKTIADLKKNLSEYRTALVSNKDDTSYLVGLFAEAQEELNNIQVYVARLENDKRHLKNVRITTAVLTGTGVGVLILANTVPMDKQFQDFLNGLGIGTAAAGVLSLGISFIF